MLALLLACTTPQDSADPLADSFRVVVISDTHIIGPDYECCSESDGIDNDSIVKTEARLRQVVAQINALEPAPEMVFILGDVMHDAYPWGDDADAIRANETAWQVTASVLDELEPELHIAWGNHDYEVECAGDGHVSRETTHTLMQEFFGVEPYHAVDRFGWRFLVTNSQLGTTWERGHARCETGLGSYGAEQLAWIDDQLSDGLPTFNFAHHMLLVTARDEEPDGPHPDLMGVLANHDNHALMLAGHTHRWLDYRDSERGPHIVVAATRYDTDNFWILQFERDGSDFDILDEDKAKWGTPCADTWRYDAWPSLDPSNPAEQGDCDG